MMVSKFSPIKNQLINSDIYVSCIVDNEFAQYRIDSDDLDKNLNELEFSLSEYLNIEPHKIKIYTISIIENLRPSYELEQDLLKLNNTSSGEHND
jgi:hypothetical protein